MQGRSKKKKIVRWKNSKTYMSTRQIGDERDNINDEVACEGTEIFYLCSSHDSSNLIVVMGCPSNGASVVVGYWSETNKHTMYTGAAIRARCQQWRSADCWCIHRTNSRSHSLQMKYFIDSSGIRFLSENIISNVWRACKALLTHCLTFFLNQSKTLLSIYRVYTFD